ncbi:alpha-L-rhamnosidase-related protein [Seonamhaeicola aphaedonensis]|uniref:Alpha-L-rhamnosidase-like protein n=1 Tax=Seonamhaeicola aphaedonensis TaxID=1461338 RepID=A0A3D9HE96_9FLAO|nr:alpha-L-rhamnosidase C-terminal domain-containing protein [Seonamhaeicola aphaedonensis]RED47802.1 alpha-L-rhamnosidase-like protein [Seonamhaeicola aphaedonensis]
MSTSHKTIQFLINTIIVFFLTISSSAFANNPNWDNAQWIWQQEDSPSNTWMSFRKTVTLDEIPKSVEAYISVDSKFWLWINGDMVIFEGGLSRGPSQAGEWNRKEKITPANSWYETLNIQPYLKKGENTIAVLVWYWGRETHKGTHIDSGKGGLLFSSEIGNQHLVSDSTWKVLQHPGYDNTIEPASRMLVQYSVKFNAQKGLNDWTDQAWYSQSFNDANWADASEKGKLGVAPWYNVEKNIVPHLINHGLQDYANHEDLKIPFVSDGTTIKARLPFNKQVTPYLEIEAKAGDSIFITTDNNRNSIHATYIAKDGLQKFESYSWFNGHEVQYTIPAGVKVKALKYRWMSVGEMAGNFQIDDPFYNRLWDMGNNTLFVCARDNFMDCPDRERALWIGDVADQTGYLFYAMDDAGRKLLKKAILQTVYFSENDVIGALGPLRVRELVCQSLQFIAQVVWPYYLNTGDKETLEIAYPYLYRYLDLFPMRDNGFPEYRKSKSPDTWNWLDWGVKGTIDEQPIQMAFYYLALRKAKKMAEVLGKEDHIQWYDERMTSMKSAYEKEFWKDGFYSSNAAKFKDDRANAIAIVSGIANPEYYNQIVDNVLIPNRFSSPHFEWMAEEAMFIAGRPKASLQRMKEMYQSQVDKKNMTTLYEKFPDGGSYNHAWNGSNTILSKYVAGVKPIKVAWSEFQIMPTMVHFKKIEKTIPTVKGNVVIGINESDSSYQLNLESPNNTDAIIGIPTSEKQVASVEINGKIVWKKGKAKKRIAGVSYVGEDDQFLKFKLSSGEWSVNAEYK